MNQDGLLDTCIARNPRSLKRLREVAFQEIWSAPQEDDPDFSMLPKDVWGLIVARCEPTRDMFTTLLLLNKERISQTVWKFFRFPAHWDYGAFVHRLLWMNVSVPRPDFWTLYGFESAEPMVTPLLSYCERYLAKEFWLSTDRRDDFDSCLRNCVMLVKTKVHVLRCLTRLFKLYHPPSDAYFICVLMTRLGYRSKGDIPARWVDQNDIALIDPVPRVFSLIKGALESKNVVLGYYNEYAARAKKDFAITMPRMILCRGQP
jgi:hypothetical protein